LKKSKNDQELIVINKTYDLILWSCDHPSHFSRNHSFVPGERIERNHYGLLETLIAAKSAHDTGLQVEDHIPQAIDLAPLNHLEGFEAVEGIVRGIKPTGDGIRRHDFGESVTETIQLLDPPKPWLAYGLPALPVGDGPLGEPGESGEHPAAKAKSAADRADGQRLRWAQRGTPRVHRLRNHLFLCRHMGLPTPIMPGTGGQVKYLHADLHNS
jgi:hypothetical protein